MWMPRTALPPGKFELAKLAKKYNLDAIHDTVHEMARDEARHGRQGLPFGRGGAATGRYSPSCAGILSGGRLRLWP